MSIKTRRTCQKISFRACSVGRKAAVEETNSELVISGRARAAVRKINSEEYPRARAT